MPKMPDFSKLTGKFDLQGIVDSVKSIITPGSSVPESIKDDPLVPRIAEISALLQQVMSVQAQQTEDLGKLNTLVNALYRDLEITKKASNAPTPGNPQTPPNETKGSGGSDNP
ncbi:MAG: hypothetical protein WBE18_02935 [Gammaproteobacteria bacterium]